MAFLKFSRDRRGYEHFYLVQPVTRRGKTRPRVLYWFRTPPNVRVGREPFDEEARRALEARNPDVSFDWRSIVETPIPSADAERWRERRRTSRSVRQSAIGEEPIEPGDSQDVPAEDESVGLAVSTLEPIADASPAMPVDGGDIRPAGGDAEAERNADAEGRGGRESIDPRRNDAPSGATTQRRRRRRRGRRGHPGPSHADSSPRVAARETDASRETTEPRDSREPGEPQRAGESEEAREPAEPSRE